MRWCSLFLVALGCALVSHAVTAHEVRTGFLEVSEQPFDVYEVRFRQPVLVTASGQTGGLDLKVVLPNQCTRNANPIYQRVDGYLTELFEMTCPGGLDPGQVEVSGLRRSITDIYATFTRIGNEQINTLLNANQPAFAPGSDRMPRISSYLAVGVGHMLGGVDHVLFVLGLILLVKGGRRVVVVATMFTLAHSLTLALSVLGLVRLPTAPVEACIALSILFLAYELTRSGSVELSFGGRHPEAVAFGFGLLHGFGFASVLSEVGLPDDQMLAALFLFNVGVEMGQLLVIVGFFSVLLLLRRTKAGWIDGFRESVTWGLGICASFFFAGTLAGLGS